MSEATLPIQAKQEAPVKTKRASSTLTRVGRYMLVRLVTLFITVVIAVYLTILIANMGGIVDNIKRGEIAENMALRVNADPATQKMSPDRKKQHITALINNEVHRLGLDRPFMLRSVLY